MAVAELKPSSSSANTAVSCSSKGFYASTHLCRRRSVSLRPLSASRCSRIYCSVTSNEVQAPVAEKTIDAKKKPECFGVFCLTYDLRAEEETASWKKLIKVAVSGAAGMIANHLLFKVTDFTSS